MPVSVEPAATSSAGVPSNDDPPAVVAGARPEVDDPVGVRHHGLVVLDHDDRLAGVDQAVEQAEQLLDVGEVQARGGLVEDVDAALLAEVGGELDALPLAARQRGERLAEGEVAEPDVGEPLEDPVRRGQVRVAVAEERQRLRHGHREHLADVPAAERVVEHLGLEPAALARLARHRDPRHHREVGVDHAGAVARGARTLGVGAEQRRLDAVLLRERLADRVEQPGVRRRVAAPRAADRALVDRHDAVAARDRAADQRALARPGHAGEHDEDAERDVDVDVLEVVQVGPAHLERSGRPADLRLERGAVVEVLAGRGAAAAQTRDVALEHDGAAVAPRTRTEVDDVVGDLDHLRLVLDDEHRVALVAQLEQQLVHPLDVVRVQPDRRLVEDVGDVGERRAEVADHPRALGLAARQRAGRALEAEVAEADLDERVERVPQRVEQRRDRRLVEAAHPLGEVVDLHRARVRDVDGADPRRPGGGVEPRALAVGAGGERDHPLDEGADVRLHRVDVLGEHRLLDLGDQPGVGEVDARRP